MFHLIRTALRVVFFIVTAQARYVFYYDQYHRGVPDEAITKGIDHVILAFAGSSLFTTKPAGNYDPFEDITALRSRFEKGTKIMIAIGGWADTVGFGIAAATEESRKLFAANIADLLEKFDFDGCDIDWEYPGGNGDDYRRVPNSEKVSEIETYPLLLAEIRKAIGDKKLLTIATPGKRDDMIAYTPEKAPSIWESVDWVNVMTYDLMNRRDTVTKYHTDVKSSLETIDYYINELNLTPEKINLGFAMYSKWNYVLSNETCTMGLGCETELMEAPDGSDTGRSGTVTFEAASFLGIPTNMTLSTNGACGAGHATFCAQDFCCSTSGFCGNTTSFCSVCQGPEYGSGCKMPNINSLFQRAVENGQTDEEAGGQYYFDRENNMFWSWDTPDLIQRKFNEIVKARKLGGVMAWSLAQDSFDNRRILALQKGIAEMA
ncbi:hypothetical protein Golomagni_05265 [Golovinomyces magnicellulatus]|nr:hypothetical protein Golomagni_05265 [Golovinomyces magnicellulatus]